MYLSGIAVMVPHFWLSLLKKSNFVSCHYCSIIYFYSVALLSPSWTPSRLCHHRIHEGRICPQGASPHKGLVHTRVMYPLQTPQVTHLWLVPTGIFHLTSVALPNMLTHRMLNDLGSGTLRRCLFMEVYPGYCIVCLAYQGFANT
jgi:hypothetical protein